MNMTRSTNLRNLKVDTGSGVNVKSTQQLKGEAQKTPAESEKNSTVQDYFGQGAGKGPWGGRNTGS